MSASSPDLSEVVVLLRSAGCVFAEQEAALIMESAHTPDEVSSMVAGRSSGLPLEHVLGWAQFCGLRIQVEPGVFVPRRRTEFLVHQAVQLTGRDDVVIDLCCGSGAIGTAVAAAVPGIELYASDIDPAAVRCARRNVEPLGGRVLEGDLYDPFPPRLLGRVDVLVANAPYVPTRAIGMLPAEARDHEPLVALDGGSDGLDVQRRVADGAVALLAPGGRLLVETSRDQAAGTARLFTERGLRPRVRRSAEYSATVVIGTWPNTGPPGGGAPG